jgi:hypothetical protein
MFAGTRRLNWAGASLCEAREWLAMDAHSCAAVLWMLLSRRKKVSFEEIKTELPWLDLALVLPQITRISGVFYLHGPPAGLSLTDDLRTAIRSGSLDG